MANRVAVFLVLFIFMAGLRAGAPVKGPHGGCYVIAVSKKTGKTYKKYLSHDKCKAVTA